MAKVESKGRQFTKCESFWDAQEGETLTGVLVDMNEKFPDSMKGEGATKPLYILKSLGVKDEKPTLSLDDKKTANKKGLLVGVFDSGDLHTKIFEKYDDLLGHEVTITYEKKEAFKASSGAQQTIKRMKVLYETEKNAEFASAVVPRGERSAGNHAPPPEIGPYKVV